MIKSLTFNYDWIYHLHVDEHDGKYFICFPDGTRFSQGYKNVGAAKSSLTNMKKIAKKNVENA